VDVRKLVNHFVEEFRCLAEHACGAFSEIFSQSQKLSRIVENLSKLILRGREFAMAIREITEAGC
jgi:hypothetical protein